MNIMQIQNPCHLCHSSRFRLIHKKDQWKYVMCLDCGLITIDPHPSEEELISNYDTYLPEDPREIMEWRTMMRPIVVKSAQIIESAHGKKPGRILDIGSGYGFFLEEMKKRGWKAEGVELSETGRKYTHDQIDATLHPSPLESLCLPAGSFDVVTLFYVIEHLSDPISTLKEVYRILRPGGLILLRWPHSTPIVKLLGPFSKKLDLFHTPFHLYDFSPKTVRKLLISASFEHTKTVVGGHTLSAIKLNRYASIITGKVAEVLYRVSGNRILVPGVSKTTVARKRIG